MQTSLKTVPANKTGVFCEGCLVVEGPQWEGDPEYSKKVLQERSLCDWPLVIVVDDLKKTLASTISFLWTVFTRFEPARDIVSKSQYVKRNQVVCCGPVAIDARMKPWYPKELFCDDQTAKTVTDNWRKYFPKNKIKMG